MADRRTVIDEGTTWTGDLAARSPVVVKGVLQGEVSGPALEVDRTGLMLGKAKTGELRARGELSGEFEAEHMELHGRVRDHTVLRARSLAVGPAAEGDPDAVFGACNIEVGEVPTKAETIAAFLNASRRPGGEGPDRPPVAPLALVEVRSE